MTDNSGLNFDEPLPTQEQAPTEEKNYLGDLALAVPRGIAHAAQDTLGLVNNIPGVDLIGKDPWLGTAHTLPGELVEGFTNFAAGFLPATRILGAVGKVGKFINLTTEAEEALQLAGKAKQAAGLAAVRGTVAGAAASFAVFNGHSSRLSNLIQQFPALQNPVSEYLAANDEDPDLLGRLKGTLEGLGLGLLTEGVILGLRRFKAESLEAVKPGATPEKVSAAGEAAVPSKEIDAALPKGGADEPVPLGEVINERKPDIAVDATSAAVEPNADNNAPPVDPAQAAAGLSERIAKLETPAKAPVSDQVAGTQKTFDEALTGMGVSVESIAKLRETVEGRKSASLIRGDINANNPRLMTPIERLDAGLKDTQMNLTRFSGDEGALHLWRSAEQVYESTLRETKPGERNPFDVRTLQVQTQDARDVVANITQGDAVVVARTAGRGTRAAAEALLSNAEADVHSLQTINARLNGSKMIAMKFASEMVEKLPSEGTPMTNATKVELLKDQDTFNRLLRLIKGGQAEQGRGLGSNNITIRPLKGLFEVLSDPKAQADVLAKSGVDVEALATAMRTAYGSGDIAGTAALSKLAQGTRTDRFVKFLTGFYVNGLLWGPKTWSVNSLSAGLLAHFLPIEHMVGGAATSAYHTLAGNPQGALQAREMMARNWGELTGLVRGVPDAFRVFKAVLSDGEQRLMPSSSMLEGSTRPADISAANLPIDLPLDGTAARAINFLGNRVYGFPSRLLAASDNFAKHVVYRAAAEAEIAQQVMKDASIPPERWGAEIVDRMDRIIYQGQSYSAEQVFQRGVDLARQQKVTNPIDVQAFAQAYLEKNYDQSFDPLKQIALNAKQHAQEATLTMPLTPGGLAAEYQSAVQRHPLMKLVTPFVQMPINIAKFSGQRIDGISVARVLASKAFPKLAVGLENSKQRLIMDVMSTDAGKQGEAMGRLSTGAALTAWGTYLASNGIITGRGPSSPEARKVLEQSGWQQYSIKTPDGYVSYQRIEPLSTLVSTMADLWDYMRYSHADDQESVEKAGFGLAVALAQNFTNKSYLTGIGNFVEMIESPDRKVEKFFQSYARAAVPNILGQAVGVVDDNTREVRSMLDAFAARIPGLSSTLPPARNMFGEPIHSPQSAGSNLISLLNWVQPIAYSESNNDVVNTALAQIGHGFSPPNKIINGIDLTQFKTGAGQDAYDRFGELHGEVRIGGLTMKDAMRKMVESSDFQKLSPLSTNELQSPQINKINTMLQDYRRKAFGQLLRENPELYNAERAYLQRKKQLRAGNDTRFFN